MKPVSENELIEKAVAPRVTLEGLEANIRSHYCYNVLEVLQAYNETHPDNQYPVREELNTLTMCVIVLNNGYTVTGQSACADPKNYNKEIGDRLAFEDAKKKIWPLMGYVLKEEIYLNNDGGFLGRMQREAKELGSRLGKAQAFIGTDSFGALSTEEKQLLLQQRNAMAEYHEVLMQRIAKAEAKA